MAGDVVKIAVPASEEAAAETAGPRLLSLRILDDSVSMRTGRAPVGIFVVLIKGVGAPKDAVAVRTRVALVSLVKLVFVPLPVKLSLKRNIAKGAPKRPLGFGCASVVALNRRCGYRRARCWWLRKGREVGGCLRRH
jgi:hypothetical protein